jgi:hypothetical protein
MPRLFILILALVAAMPAAEGKGQHPKLGAVLGRQVIDSGHILEARAVNATPGQVVIRWGDLDKTVAKGAGTHFDWTGSASADHIALVQILAFEDGKADGKKGGKHGGDKITGDGYAGSVSWQARTSSATDGVVVRATSGSTLQITAGPASLSIAVP